MSTTWKEFIDEHNKDFRLRIESGCRGIKIEIECKDYYGHWQLLKFFLREDDIEDFKLGLDLAKQHV